jgi:2-polyprenyl-3-methyl-5-hydroxy-6-metoxy-1,4-benzoquinol methylase
MPKRIGHASEHRRINAVSTKVDDAANPAHELIVTVWYDSIMQVKQDQWAWQWNKLYDDNKWLFTEWIHPNTLEDFRGKTILDCGCGGGQHLQFVAPFAAEVTGVDLNALESAQKNTAELSNVKLVEGDIAAMNLGKQFDVVYSIGVLHHTDDPTASFRNIANHAKPGGRVIVWVYSHEGNALNRWLVEPAKTMLVHSMPRAAVLWLARILTALVYLPVYTIYLLPLTFLPYYQYFQNWRQLSFERNVLNVFDKLNAPQTWFITKDTITGWFSEKDFTDIHVSPYKGVSWRGSGTKR